MSACSAAGCPCPLGSDDYTVSIGAERRSPWLIIRHSSWEASLNLTSPARWRSWSLDDSIFFAARNWSSSRTLARSQRRLPADRPSTRRASISLTQTNGSNTCFIDPRFSNYDDDYGVAFGGIGTGSYTYRLWGTYPKPRKKKNFSSCWTYGWLYTELIPRSCGTTMTTRRQTNMDKLKQICETKLQPESTTTALSETRVTMKRRCNVDQFSVCH